MIEKTKIKDDVIKSMSALRIELSEELYGRLTGVMNEIHRTGHSERFWRILLEGHVKAVISRIKLLEKQPVYRKPEMFPFNKHSFPTVKEIAKQRLIDFVKHLKSAPKKRRVNTALMENNKIRIGFFEYPNLDREGIGARLPNYHPFVYGRGDREKRRRANGIADGIEEPFFSNVVRQLPTILVEHYEKMILSAGIFSPEEKELHVHTTQTVFNEFLIANYVEHGARLFWYQHGSYYGEYRHDSAHHYEHSVADEFRTWGWKIKEKDRPWKAYRLEKFRRDYIRANVKMDRDLLIAYSRVGSGKREKFKEVTETLLSQLDEEKFGKILARPQPSNKVYSHRSELDFIDDDRVTKTSGLNPMAEEMKRCRVVLQLSVPSTNFLECIYANHPTVGILKIDRPSEIIRPYYDYFLQVGLLHHTLESLTSHLNSVIIEEWWDRVSKDRQFIDFRRTFARRVE